MQVEIEHKVFVVTIDEATMQNELNKITSDGWVAIPEIKPVAVYHMVRAKGQPAAAAAVGAQLRIDDSKVGILKMDGNVHWPDGTVTKAGEFKQ
jgi:hypothetical protein